MSNKLKALIIAVIAALGVGGYVGFIADEPCQNAQVQILVVDEDVDSQDVYWCGTEEEAEEYRIALAENIENVSHCDEYDAESELTEADQDKACEEAKIAQYAGWIREDERFYSIMNPILKQKIDDVALVDIQVEAVKAHEEYSNELEPIFAEKYNQETNSFDGTVLYQRPILNEVVKNKLEKIKGENEKISLKELLGTDNVQLNNDSRTLLFFNILSYGND